MSKIDKCPKCGNAMVERNELDPDPENRTILSWQECPNHGCNRPASKRLKEWQAFSDLVECHIEEYTVPQYGDAPKDQLSEFSEQDIITNMKRYLNRMTTNARGFEESQRDLLKLAHYAAVLYMKRERETSK